ncbi:SUMF1/EgtB/PvdO family nonheme iron enzyme, partial [Candidatus Eisenbacteria bacterium]
AYDNGYVNASTISVWDNLDGRTEELLDLDTSGTEIQFDGEGTFSLWEATSDAAQNAYPDGYDPANHPVKEVTWWGAARYCDWLSLQNGVQRAYEHTGDWSCNGGDPYGAEGYRLPTDAEWEYATQCEGERRFPWGDEWPSCAHANCQPYPLQVCIGWTTLVGSYPAAPEALGLSDMAGNTWEWCNDWHECHLGTDPVIDPTGPASGVHRVLRSSEWSHTRSFLRCAYRYNYFPVYSVSKVSFRIARTADPQAVKQSDPNRTRLLLKLNAPNPFTSRTQIRYSLPSSSPAVVNVYDATGRMIRTLRDTSHGAGVHSVTWDGRNVSGEPVPGGVYFYELRWNGHSMTKRMLLMR